MAKTQTASPGLFEQWFPGKRWYRMVMCRRESPLTLGQRVLYSYAWYRTKYGGVTMAEAARATGLDQGRTVPQARDELVGRGLLTRAGNLMVACPLPARRPANSSPGTWLRTGATSMPRMPPPTTPP